MAILGCKGEQTPDGILNIEQMAAILIGIHIAEGKIVEMQQRGDTAAIILKYFEDEIYKKHDVDREVYEESFKYHLINVKTLDQIYAQVVDSLNVRKEIKKID